MTFFNDLKSHCATEWHAYTHHPFVLGLGDGSLPEAAFRHYLKQDYLFLIQFARAQALAGYKARSLDDLYRAKEGMQAILDIELELHRQYCKEWGISLRDLEIEPEGTANLAYTRYVLERGMAGNLLDLYVALVPCMLGYGEIGLALSPCDPGNPYAAWINMYAGDEYQKACRDTRTYLDDLAGHALSVARKTELAKTFSQATRLEIDFWQMGLDAA
jgi:thiaminase/transcriptional activator TenA